MMLKHLSHRNLLSPPTSSSFRFSILIARFSTSSLSASTLHFSDRHDETRRNVRVCVWWDFENCHLPSGVNVFKVGRAITGALRANGIRGPVQITAFGDVLQLSRANQEALSATGINLTHIPNGGKNSSDRSLLVDLMYWVSQNPPPAHLFLISGDRDFANILHRLRMSNYNILLATKNDAPSVLCSAASIMWNWNSLVKGEDLRGKHFSQPPDGSYGSWYGNSKVPVEDPFFLIEQPTCLPCEDMSRSSSELQLRPIPEAVQRKIHDILSLNPKGIAISDLGNELKKSGVVLDKNFYGHKKLSHFLLSMPNILELQPMSDGQHVVCGIFTKGPEPFVPRQSSATGNQQLAKSSKSTGKDASISQSSATGNQQLAKSSKSKGKDASISQPADVKSSLPPSSKEQLRKIEKYQPPPVAEEAAKVDIKPLERAEQPSLVGENVDLVNAQLTESSSVKDKDSTSEVGTFKTLLWKILFGNRDDTTEIKSSDITKEVQISGDLSDQRTLGAREKCITSGDFAGNEVKVNDLKLPIKGFDSVKPASCSISSVESTLEKNTAFDSYTSNKKSGKTFGLFSQILNWFKFKSNGPNSQRLSDEPSQELEHINRFSRKLQVFAEDSFWRDLESFIGTKNGLLIISQSRTRQQMAQNLQKEGPLVLRSLKESDILELVDMLISEKKWLEECPSEASPFKLTRCIGSNTSHSNGLRSLFLKQVQPDLRLKEQSGDKRIQNISHAGVSGRFPFTCRKHLGRTREEVLKDCHKLASEIVKEFPGGRSIGSFRKLFLEKFGYQLDIQKLGFNKLAHLLQTIPGIEIEYSIMIPASKASKSEGQVTAVSDIKKSITYHDSEVAAVSDDQEIITNRESQDAAVSDIQKSIPNRKSRDSNRELSYALEEGDESDSPWDELGPVTNISSKRNELESSLREMRRKDTHLQTHADYEPSLSDDDDDLSDSDGESKVVTQQKEQAKPETIHESSSLLKLLSSYDDDDEDDKRRAKSEDVQDEADSDKNRLEPWNSYGRGTKLGNSSGKYGLKQNPQKCYSFVAEMGGSTTEKLSDSDDKTDKVLDSILSNINVKR